MISVFGSDLGDDEIQEVISSIKNQWVGLGPKVEEFESLLAKRLDVPDVALVDSGSNALLLGTHLLDLPKGAEIILPSLTWVACAHAVTLAGYKPIFCDVDLESYNVTANLIEPHINSRTGAIMIVHYAGLPVDIKPILSFDYPIIEDAAHAIDSKINDKFCGTFGELGIFSFDPVKNLATCDAGAIVGSKELVGRAKKLRYCGIVKSGFHAAINGNVSRWWEHEIVEAFPRIIPNDISASIGIAQLNRLPQLQERRRQIWQTYHDEFSSLNWIKLPLDANAYLSHSYFTYLIRVPAKIRDQLAHFLYEAGVYTTLRYHPLHKTELYRTNYKLHNTEIIANEGLNLPLHPRMTDMDIEKVINLIKSFSTRL
ncbi:DegT/DnrJ/EryC1/StrS aminotransferase family protein [Paenibacillus sp. Y412MC10]|uniref:DegT/DnrJ/EryC1/StrS family aminotransferase n=1 Tax=Geobacillus sp. (strain Y412MC10) TaxID=481743 RepID=UPI0011AB3DE3|nr:DegT/DnrJ/EryC1/StrS family aminotransferase [Paenibacillus sp. Y412MC10]